MTKNISLDGPMPIPGRALFLRTDADFMQRLVVAFSRSIVLNPNAARLEKAPLSIKVRFCLLSFRKNLYPMCFIINTQNRNFFWMTKKRNAFKIIKAFKITFQYINLSIKLDILAMIIVKMSSSIDKFMKKRHRGFKPRRR